MNLSIKIFKGHYQDRIYGDFGLNQTTAHWTCHVEMKQCTYILVASLPRGNLICLNKWKIAATPELSIEQFILLFLNLISSILSFSLHVGISFATDLDICIERIIQSDP